MRLKQDTKPHLDKPCPVSLPQKEEFKEELDRQYEENTPHKLPPLEVETSDYGFPMFGMPKKDKKQTRTVRYFRVLNIMIVRTPWYIELLHELLCSIGHFAWASDLDLPMTHCSMSLFK